MPKCTILSPNIKKKLWGGGTVPYPEPTPIGEGDTPSPNPTLSAPAAPRYSRFRRSTCAPGPFQNPGSAPARHWTRRAVWQGRLICSLDSLQCLVVHAVTAQHSDNLQWQCSLADDVFKVITHGYLVCYSDAEYFKRRHSLNARPRHTLW